MTLPNARARHDPLVRGLDLLRKIGVGDDPLRKIRTAAEDLRSHFVHSSRRELRIRSDPRRGKRNPALCLVDAIGDQLDGDTDGVCETESVRTAMTLDAHAVESEEHRSIMDARINARMARNAGPAKRAPRRASGELVSALLSKCV